MATFRVGTGQMFQCFRKLSTRCMQLVWQRRSFRFDVVRFQHPGIDLYECDVYASDKVPSMYIEYLQRPEMRSTCHCTEKDLWKHSIPIF
jgi:hypothetical protein